MLTQKLNRTFGAIILALVIGCSPVTTVKAPPAEDTNDEHAHKPAAHGGIIVEIGRDNYHAEAVFEKGGTLRLYMLGQDEARVQEVEAKSLEAYAKAEGDAESTKFVMQPQPQPGDRAGQTSLFVGQLPAELVGKRIEVTIPNVTIGDGRFRIAFRSQSDAADTHGMPTKVGDEEERKLYLTAAGKYTEADIVANGRQLPSQKFKGIQAAHDMKPKSGDRLCPITNTKANPKFTWVVGGKAYEFCCPPCVDEFVLMAKEKPEEIKDPQEYIKK